MKSIRMKLTLGAALLFAASIGVLVAANLFLLEPFYAFQTKGDFAGIAEAVKASPPGNASRLQTVRNLAMGTGYKIIIVDGSGTVRASSAPEFRDGQSFPLPREQFEFIRSSRDRLSGGESIFTSLDGDPQGQSVLQLAVHLERDSFLLITQPLEYLRRNIVAASRFFLLAGTLILFILFVLVLLFSGWIVKPILELSAMARAVASGRLDTRYGHRRDDEIGILGDSINEMAATLARNIADLTDANRELALKIKAQGSFIAGASHELKTPVGLMRGYAEAISLGMYGTDRERDELASVILNEADHLDRLVRDLSQIAVFEGSSTSLFLADADLGTIVSAAIARFSLQAREKQVGLECDLPVPIPARLDADRIIQVMDNLLSNAMRHVHRGGSVTVRVHREIGNAVVEIENTGDTVDPESMRNLFTPFFRADSSRTRKSGGSGLGLAVVKSIVQAHGGTCGAQNTGDGMCFWFSLPVTAS